MNSQTNDASITGIVLSCSDYKDRDALVTVAAKNGLYSCLFRGVQSGASKNRRLTQPYTKVKLEYAPKYSRDILYILHGTVLDSWPDIADSLEKSALLGAVIERWNQQIYKGSWMEGLEQLLIHLDADQMAYAWSDACWLMAQIIEAQGIRPEVDRCALCGSVTSIVAFDQETGGFVCSECANELTVRNSREELLKLRAVFRARLNNLEALETKFTFHASDFLRLCGWYCYQMNSHPASIRFLETVLNMK